MTKKKPNIVTNQDAPITRYKVPSGLNLPDFEKYKLQARIDAPLVAHIEASLLSYVARTQGVKASLAEFENTSPLINYMRAEWETAEREADELINFINNTHVPFQDISKLPPVKMMTVLAIMSKVEAEPKRIKEKISKMLKGLDNGRRDGVAKRKHTATHNTNVIRQAIDDLFKNGKGWEMTNEEIADFLLDRQISRYRRSTMLGRVKKLVPSIKQKYKSGL